MSMANKYLDLAKAGTNYAKKMNYLSNRIFGEIARPASLRSRKVVKLLSEQPKYKNPDIVDYYHRLPEAHYLTVMLRQYGLYRDEHADFVEEMARLRKLRGKEKGKNPVYVPKPDRPFRFKDLDFKQPYALQTKGPQ